MAEEPSPPPPTRLPSLTGLRFFGALLVFVFHAGWESRFIGGSTGAALSTVVGRAGALGVGFFFVLSGFVLAWTARDSDTVWKFFRRRLVKIFPSHLVTFVIAGALLIAAGTAIPTLVWLPNLFLVQSWVPDMMVANGMNGVTWSLSCELLFYLSFPLAYALLRRIAERWLWATAAILVALIVAAPLVAQFLLPSTPKLPPMYGGTLSFVQIWFVYYFPPVRLLEFLLGIVLARIVAAGRWPRIGLLPALLIALAGYVVMLNVPYLFGSGGTESIWMAPLIASAAVADWRGTRSITRSRALIWLGNVSFAFYLVHHLVIQEFHALLGAYRTWSPLVGGALVLASFGLALLAASVLYHFVEMPMVRRFGRPRPPVPRRRRGATRLELTR
jgi:peptidoglycan/LPS O-acetylase OafA/YrhL